MTCFFVKNHYHLSLLVLDIYGPLAQLVEQRTFNPLVIGSNPIRPIIYGGFILEFPTPIHPILSHGGVFSRRSCTLTRNQ